MKRILVICGGGMKGYPAAAALDEMRTLAGGLLHKHVDLFAGTSVGGILAGMAAAWTLGDCTDFFTKEGPNIFKPTWYRHWPKYPAGPIEDALQRIFAGRTLRDCRSKLLVTALNRTQQVPLMFKSYDASSLPEGVKTPLWKVGRATSAAQRYFPAFRLGTDYIWDGGNIANNPAVCAYAEACKLWPGERVKVLTLGCGEDNVPAPRWPQWVQDLVLTIGLQFNTSQDEVDYQMDQFTSSAGNCYRCLQPQFDRPVTLDGADAQSLAWLGAAATRFVAEHRMDFEWFLD
jgi:patatin-like phospholipase/acyl hydrolase